MKDIIGIIDRTKYGLNIKVQYNIKCPKFDNYSGYHMRLFSFLVNIYWSIIRQKDMMCAYILNSF